jgi:hypothetical protein
VTRNKQNGKIVIAVQVSENSMTRQQLSGFIMRSGESVQEVPKRVFQRQSVSLSKRCHCLNSVPISARTNGSEAGESRRVLSFSAF